MAEVPGPMEDPPSVGSDGPVTIVPREEPETPVAHNKSFFITDRQVSLGTNPAPFAKQKVLAPRLNDSCLSIVLYNVGVFVSIS